MASLRRGRSRAAVLLSRPALVVTLALAITFAGPLALRVAAATPGPSPQPTFIDPGDPRSEGVGPGLVGSPLFVAAAVVGLGILVAGSTLVLMRLTRDD